MSDSAAAALALPEKIAMSNRGRAASGIRAKITLILMVVLSCGAAGALLATKPPAGIVLMILASGALALGLVSSAAGSTGMLVLLFGGVTLIPVVAGAQGSDPQTASNHVPTPTIYGVEAESIRTAFIALLVFAAAILLRRPRPTEVPARVRRVAGGLMALAILGVVGSAFTAHGGADYLRSASQAAGQPLIYMVLLLTAVALLGSEPKARRLLVVAWCFAVVAQGVIVGGQLVTGAAYDALRGLTRAQGTMGADFLGVFAVMGVFGGAYLRLIAETKREHALGTVAVGSGVFVLVASVSRGPLIGLAVAIASLALSGGSSRGRAARIASAFAVTLVAGMALYLMQGLWTARLSASSTSSFDRPATWISGARLAVDHALTGVGPAHVAEVVASSPRYSETPYGYTLSNPHNSWLFVADAEGLAYALILVGVSVMFVLSLGGGAKSPGGRYLVASLVAGGTVFVINNLFNHPEIMLFVILAASLILTEESVPSRSIAPPRHPAAAARPPHGWLRAERDVGYCAADEVDKALGIGG